jgi:hypothetical protein
MHGYKVLQLNKTNQLSINFHLLANFSKKINLPFYIKNLNLYSILFFQNSSFNSGFNKKLVPQLDCQFKSRSQELEPPLSALPIKARLLCLDSL